jgi:hypothetical protein
VRITGVNPAIILVQGDATVESGGRILVHGDGQNGTPNSAGENGVAGDASLPKPAGGRGSAGGGDGGAGDSSLSADLYAFNGKPGFGSPSYGVTPTGRGGPDPVLTGPGRGTIDVSRSIYGYSNRNAPAGGGGGHASAGVAGQAGGTGSNPVSLPLPPDGAGGSIYGDPTGLLRTPEAGSGGGGGGYARSGPYYPYYYYHAAGGGGGAGGGFLDLTASGDIRVFGTIDANGGRGGNGANVAYDYYGSAGGGGGGGSGGAIRLLTPKRIYLATTTVITANGGAGGTGGYGGTMNPPVNNGGNGGVGRIVLETVDSTVTGSGGATIVPGEGKTGFYRGVFDPSRFAGGGLRPVVVTQVLDVGPHAPAFVDPVQDYGVTEDFIAGIPNAASQGIGRTAIFLEMRGYDAQPDGSPEATPRTGWKAVGYFTDSGNELAPTWHLGVPADVTVPADDTGGAIADVSGSPFCQLRITFFLKQGMGPFDPGPYVDRWTARFRYDQ